MAFNPAPNAWISGWSEDGTTISFPIASIPGLTAGEADGATGDIRKVLYAMCEKLYDHWASLPTADRPAKMTINRVSFLNDADDTTNRNYDLRFITATSGTEDVVNE